MTKRYFIQAKQGTWEGKRGQETNIEAYFICEVLASSKEQALEKFFDNRNLGETKQFLAIPYWKLSQLEKEWFDTVTHEIID